MALNPHYVCGKCSGYKAFYSNVCARCTVRCGKQRRTTPRATTHPTIRDLHWIAGFLEGEACFRTTNQCAEVGVAQLQREPLERLQRFLGGTIKIEKRKPNDLNKWSVCGSRARGVMMTVYPLMSPRRQAQIANSLKVEHLGGT